MILHFITFSTPLIPHGMRGFGASTPWRILQPNYQWWLIFTHTFLRRNINSPMKSRNNGTNLSETNEKLTYLCIYIYIQIKESVFRSGIRKQLPAKDNDIDVSLPVQSINYCPYYKECADAICTKVNYCFQRDQVNIEIHYHSSYTQQCDSKNNDTDKSLSRQVIIML